MQMPDFEVGMDRPLVGSLQPEIEDLGNAMIDPDDGVIVNSHDELLLKEEAEGRFAVSATSAREPSSNRTCRA